MDRTTYLVRALKPGVTLGASDSSLSKEISKVVDGSAGAATAEQIVFAPRFRGKLLDVSVEPDAALTANNTNYASLLIDKRPASGPATPVNVVTLTTEVASGSWTAWTSKSLGTLANNSFVSGDKFTFEITKSGTGVIVPDLLLVLTYAFSGEGTGGS